MNFYIVKTPSGSLEASSISTDPHASQVFYLAAFCWPQGTKTWDDLAAIGYKVVEVEFKEKDG